MHPLHQQLANDIIFTLGKHKGMCIHSNGFEQFETEWLHPKLRLFAVLLYAAGNISHMSFTA